MANLIDITGNKYGRLTVIKRVEDSVCKKSGKRQPQWLCQCDCGNTAICQAANLKSGKSRSCGCLWKEKHSKATVSDLAGQRFGRLVVLNRAGDVASGKRKVVNWLCQCDCGNTITVRACNLKNGSTVSCGCYNKERTFETHFKDKSGEKFNYLTIMPFYEMRQTGKRKSKYLMCLCDCGNITFAQYSSLKTNNIISCGCIGSSNGEYQIMQYLKEKKIDHKKEFTFPDLLTELGFPMRFDFAIFENEKLKCLIEYQGEQHYSQTPFGKQQREVTDIAKKEYCSRNNIKLCEIKYTENIIEALESILYGNSVPSAA